MRLTWLLLVAATAGCGGREVAVRVSIPDLAGIDTPVPDLLVTFLPYDRDSILTELEAKAGPRPHAAELDSLFALFRVPFRDLLVLATLRDRLARERDDLASRGSPGSARLDAINDSLAKLAPELARARAALDRARAAYWPRMDSLRHEAQRWNAAAYAGYDSIVRGLPGRRFATPVADTTDARGWAAARLTRGRWWVTARSVDPGDPNAEWYWNVAIERDTVLLNSHTGRNRPRY